MLKGDKREGKLGEKETFEIYRFKELGVQAFDMHRDVIDEFLLRNNLDNNEEMDKL